LQVGTSLAVSLAHQTHLPDATSLHPGAVSKNGTGGSYVEKPTSTKTLRLVCNGATNSRSGGHEFESPVRQELGALTKK
jgi:hypothetical protein